MTWPGLWFQKILASLWWMDFEEQESKLAEQSGGHWGNCCGGWDRLELGFCTEHTEKTVGFGIYFQLEATKWIGWEVWAKEKG